MIALTFTIINVYLTPQTPVTLTDWKKETVSCKGLQSILSLIPPWIKYNGMLTVFEPDSPISKL
jgi:hypothetical protein